MLNPRINMSKQTVKRNDISHFAESCIHEQRRQQETQQFTEPEKTEGSDTDKSINILTDIKLVTDQKLNKR